MSIEKQYGSWSSPISPALCTSNTIKYTYLCQDQCNTIKSMVAYWIELRPIEKGRCVILSKDFDCKNDMSIMQWTPESFSARTTVHEYGGADMFVHNGIVYFSNEYDQHLYKQEKPLSKPIIVANSQKCRFSNGFYCTKLNAIFIVCEDHTDEKNVRNSIVVIKDSEPVNLIFGKDFYSSPRVTENGEKLCWIEWTFPNMPWDNTSVCTAQYDDQTTSIVPGSIQTIATGTDLSPLSCTLPMWTKSNDLLYIKDETGFWNVWITSNSNEQKNLTPVDEDIGDPMWMMDYRKYNYSSFTDQIVVARKGGRLEWKNCDGSRSEIVDFQSVLSYIYYPLLLPNGSVIAMGHSPSRKSSIYQLSNDGKHTVVGINPFVEGIDPKFFSIPRHLKYPVKNYFSYGYFYAPCNPNYSGIKGTLPPLLVQVHGGPTAAAYTNLNLKIQYYTSRGFAVLDVDYRGSTGYGKEYRHLLRDNWGVYDFEDCCEGVNYLVKEGLVDGNMAVISGGSAGGYSVLCCLTFSSVFKAGCSLYGVADLKGLIEDTHKFESKYLDILVGKYDERPDLYKDRSPIHFPENIKCPMIFFQGDKDKIVPKEQSLKMFEAVKSNAIPCSLVMYEGESHGFRKIENILHQMENEFYFYSKIFGFETPDIQNPSITIENFV